MPSSSFDDPSSEQAFQEPAEEASNPVEPAFFPVTGGLIGVLGVVYLITTWPTFDAPQRFYVEWGVFYAPLIETGQWWRLLTGNVLHSGLPHLFSNAFGLFIFGRFLEPALGSLRTLGLLIVAALGGDLAMYFFSTSPALGASGMVYGCIASYLTFSLIIQRQQNPEQFKAEFRGALLYIVLFLGWDWMNRESIAIWGHLGGFVAGALYAVVLAQPWRPRPRLNLVSLQEDDKTSSPSSP